MADDYGFRIPDAPDGFDGAGVMTRVVDGLAFRYRWATEGLRPEDFEFRPGPTSMTTRELMKHVLHLVFMIKQSVFDAAERERPETDDPAALRGAVLDNLRIVRERLDALDDATLARHGVLKRDGSRWPIWNILNGPLADALTHVGQINAWRRLNGNPTPAANVFAGEPPAEP
jgi:hypothetical protein